MESVNAISIPAKGRFQMIVRVLWGDGGSDQPEATGDAVDVGVDRKRWASEGEEEDTGGRLRSDAGELTQPRSTGFGGHCVQRVQVRSIVPFDGLEDAPDARRLDVGQPSRPDGIGDVGRGGQPDRLPVGKAAAKFRIGAGGIGIRRVLGEHGHHQFVQRGTVASPPLGTVGVVQAVDHGGNPSGPRRREM